MCVVMESLEESQGNGSLSHVCRVIEWKCIELRPSVGNEPLISNYDFQILELLRQLLDG